MILIENITKRFGGIYALRDVSFSVEKGEIFGIIGPNGSGKTTLFNIISGIYRPDGGRVIFDGVDITRKSPWDIAKMGIMRTFQQVRLFELLTVLDNIMLGGFLLSKFFFGFMTNYYEIRRKAEEIIDFLDLQYWRNFLVRDIPIGVRKKVELGRAIMTTPKLLLLDEPTSGLTREEKNEVKYYISEINGRLGSTLIVIEHDTKFIFSISRRVVCLSEGRKIAEGTPEEIIENKLVREVYLSQ